VRAARPGEGGFTLVELLVASVILGLVATLMLGGMRFAGRATESADARREAVESTLTGLGLLRLTLGRALPLHTRVENRDRLAFEGGAERVRFATFEPDYVPGWPLVAYEYAVAERGGRYLLEVRRAALDPSRPDLAGALEEAPPARAVLGFAGPVRLAYYGAPGPRDVPGWRGEWRGAEAQALPRAVRVGPDVLEPAWPDFVVPLAIDTPAACLTPDAQNARGCGQAGGGGAAAGTGDGRQQDRSAPSPGATGGGPASQ
jgi:general secretion pathway protein J